MTVLKPLHGLEPRLYENLRSFCLQAYPVYQLVFGVCGPEDPAIAVVDRLQTEFPQRDMTLVVNPRMHGANPKVSNLINMLPVAEHDWLVLSDSDISAPPDYLARVTAPLAVPAVGIVTCLYHGIVRSGFWSRLGRLFVDDWFIPSVRLAYMFNSDHFAFGATIALRRDVLEAIGGFGPLRDTLADDFWLGELTRRLGLRTVVSDLVVGTQVSHRRLSSLWTHELRWLRTTRAIAPLGFAMLWVCFTTPIALLGLILAPGILTAGLVLLGLGARALVHFKQRHLAREWSPWWEVALIPLRDVVLLVEWAAALTGWQVEWKGRILDARTPIATLDCRAGAK